MSTAVTAPEITVTPAAVNRIKFLLEEEGNPNLKLRVYITGGGCSGFQYGFAFDENVREDDNVIENDEADMKINVLVDALSMMYLTGAEIDYVETLQGAHFTIRNPNAQTTCSCGSSFSIG